MKRQNFLPRRWLRIGIIATLLACMVVGAPDAIAFTLIGNGVSSCGSWTADRREVGGNPVVTFGNHAWLLGFLSGVGYAGTDFDPLRGLDAGAVSAWVDNYCAVRPLNDISIAAEAFVAAHPR